MLKLQPWIFTIFIFICAAAHATAQLPPSTKIVDSFGWEVSKSSLPIFDPEPSIISKMDFYSWISLSFVFLFATLTGSVGLSSASLTTGIILFGFQVHADEALRLINITTFSAAVINNLFVITVRRQDDADELYLDWGLAAYCLPQVFAGSMIGLVFKKAMPEGYGYIATGLLILVLSYMANKEANRIEMHEESGFQSNLSDRTWIRVTDSSAHFFKNLTSVARSSLLEIVSKNLLQILVIKFSVILMIVGNLARTWPAAQSAIGLTSCSVLILLIFLACTGMISYLSYCAKQRVQTNYNPQRQMTLIITSFWAGVFFWSNPAGSVVFWLFLFILGVEPMTVWAVSSSQLFYTSLGAVIQDMLITPSKDYITIGIFAGIGALGALLGNFFIQRRFKSGYGAQSIVGKVGCLVSILSLTVMFFNGYQGRQDNSDFWRFGAFC